MDTHSKTHSMRVTIPDAAAFGGFSELSGLNLPTALDVLKNYFYWAELAGRQSRVLTFKTFTPHIVDRVCAIWTDGLDIELMPRESIYRKLNALIDAFNTSSQESTLPAFVESTKELFYIGKCECDLKAARCACELIPERLKSSSTINIMREN